MSDAMGVAATTGPFHLAGHPWGQRHRPGACGTGRNRMVILPFF
jgi:hypothetical protein